MPVMRFTRMDDLTWSRDLLLNMECDTMSVEWKRALQTPQSDQLSRVQSGEGMQLL